MAKKKQITCIFHDGDVVTLEDVTTYKIEIIDEREFTKRNNEAVNEHNAFLNVNEWRKFIKWEIRSIDEYAIKKKKARNKYLIRHVVKYYNTDGSIMHIQENLDALFKHHPFLNTFKFDDFSKDNIFNNEIYDEDTKPAEIFNFFRRTFDGWCERADIKDSIQETLNNNKCNIVTDYFDSLIWDGIPRLETFLIDYYKAEDTMLNRVYFTRWMIALIKRVYEPGCKFDNMLVLYGEQGKKKSSLFEWLGTINNKIFCNHLPQDLKNIKQLVYATKNAFIMMNDDFDDICDKGNIGIIKEFVTKRVDRTDLKFKHAKDYPRHYVLCATTNNDTFLSDDKTFDERRFWIVYVNPDKLEFDLTDELKEQLYAEATYYYKSDKNMKLWIHEPELIEAEKELQKTYKKASDDPLTEKIMSIFNRKYPIINGKFDDFKHFKALMEGYNEVYNPTIRDVDYINRRCEEDNIVEGSKWEYVTDIPSSWIIDLFAMGKRSTDRIIQILHTQNVTATKATKVWMYGVYSTHILISRA